MKPFFSNSVLGASEERTLPPCTAIKVYSATGTVTIRFNDGDAVPAKSGDVFETPWPMQFEKALVITAAASAATVIFGVGSFGGGAGGGAGLYGTGSPEAAQTADPGTTYYDTSGGGFWVKATGTGNTGWVQLIA